MAHSDRWAGRCAGVREPPIGGPAAVRARGSYRGMGIVEASVILAIRSRLYQAGVKP